VNKTSIDWTDMSWNPVTGCSRKCDYCYAARIAKRFGRSFEPTYHPERLTEPLRRKKPSKIFACSMGDLFDPAITHEQIERAFGVMAITPHHVYQVLTKRPERMLAWAKETSHGFCVAEATDVVGELYAHKRTRRRVLDQIGPGWPWPLPNVWLGTSVTSQADADERIPLLLQAPAAVRWVSVEPLMGSIHLDRWLNPCGCGGLCDSGEPCPMAYNAPRLGWIVLGAMTGPGAVPPRASWVESIIGQCAVAGVPLFVKDNVAKPLGWPYVPAELRRFPEVEND